MEEQGSGNRIRWLVAILDENALGDVIGSSHLVLNVSAVE
jgi:hypothetical protein